MDTSTLQYLPYILLVIGSILGVFGIVVASLLKPANGLPKFLGILLAVGLITLAIYCVINSVAAWFYAQNPGLAIIFWIAFSGLLSLLASAVFVYKAAFPDAIKIPAETANQPKT